TTACAARAPSKTAAPISMYCAGVRSFFFFFQAEDGIRDGHVTGVQTCALPICRGGWAAAQGVLRSRLGALPADDGGAGGVERFRSEERRVGKEWRFRWARYH